jgi:hypothetical protein
MTQSIESIIQCAKYNAEKQDCNDLHHATIGFFLVNDAVLFIELTAWALWYRLQRLTHFSSNEFTGVNSGGVLF